MIAFETLLGIDTTIDFDDFLNGKFLYVLCVKYNVYQFKHALSFVLNLQLSILNF